MAPRVLLSPERAMDALLADSGKPGPTAHARRARAVASLAAAGGHHDLTGLDLGPAGYTPPGELRACLQVQRRYRPDPWAQEAAATIARSASHDPGVIGKLRDLAGTVLPEWVPSAADVEAERVAREDAMAVVDLLSTAHKGHLHVHQILWHANLDETRLRATLPILRPPGRIEAHHLVHTIPTGAAYWTPDADPCERSVRWVLTGAGHDLAAQRREGAA